MIEAETIIVGGGPAGAACALGLQRHGHRSIVLDQAQFPRLKLCAGWITPKVAEDIELSPEHYPHSFMKFDRILCTFFGKRHERRRTLRTEQLSIRRTEFDYWLLERSGAEVHQHKASRITRDDEHYIIDDRFRSRHVVGAGGTQCPVYRAFFRDQCPRSEPFQIIALEEEFEYPYEDPECQLWFGENQLCGYSWYVPKGNGYLNVGLGAFAAVTKARKQNLWDHWSAFIERLDQQGLVAGHSFQPKGHSYYIREVTKRARIANAFVVGDAAGLATRDLAEGIGPAIESGLAAANAIVSQARYRVERVTTYSSLGQGLVTWLLRNVFDRRGLLFRNLLHARMKTGTHGWQ